MKKFPALFFLITIISCNRAYLITTANGYNIAKSKEFKLQGFNLNNSSVLSSNNLYELSCYDGARWLKFYSDGKVCSGLEIIHPDNYYRDTLSLSGYYKLEGDDLTMEITDGGKFKNDWSILVVKGKVVGDTLKFYKAQWRCSGKNVNHFTNLKSLSGQECYYIKSNKVFSFKPPDW